MVLGPFCDEQMFNQTLVSGCSLQWNGSTLKNNDRLKTTYPSKTERNVYLSHRLNVIRTRVFFLPLWPRHATVDGSHTCPYALCGRTCTSREPEVRHSQTHRL